MNTASTIYNYERIYRYSDGLIDVLFGFLLLFCCLTSTVRITGRISMILFCLYSFLIIRNQTLFFLKYLAIILFIDMNIAGCYAIEYSDFYLYELSVNSSFAGSLPLLIFSRWLTLPVMSAMDRLLNIDIDDFRTISPGKSNWIDVFSVVFLILVLVCFAPVALHPAFLLGIDRFEFANTFTSAGIASKISGYLNELAIIPMLSIRHGNRRIGIFSLFFYALYLFWIGTQFGAYFTLVSMLILAFIDRILIYPQDVIRRIGYIFLAVIISMVFIAVKVRSMTSSSSLQSMDYLLQRTAQQGQLWWRTYDMGKNDVVVHRGFSDEIRQQLSASTSVADNVGSTFGIYGVMYRTAPADRVSLQLSKGSAYAEAGYAAAYYYFGPLGAVGFSLIVGTLASLITNGFLFALMHGGIVEAILYSRLLVLVRGLMGTFIFTGLLSIISIFSYCYLLGAFILRIYSMTQLHLTQPINSKL